MNWVDIILLIVVVFGIWGGWQKGFIISFLDLAALIISVLAAYFLYPYVSIFAERNIPALGAWTRPASFLFIFGVIRIGLSLLFNSFSNMLNPEAHRGVANRFAGLAPGLAHGLINAIVLSAILLAIPFWKELSAGTKKSRIAAAFSVPAEWLEERISPVFDEAIRKNMNKMTVEPGSNESVRLPFTVNSPEIREDLEARMLELVNDERIREGLRPLKADPEMAKVARAHSRDMFARGYFAHLTPEGRDPFDRMRAGGVTFLTAGENLALAQTLRIAHNGLMNSPGHRANILRPSFGRLGIGVLDGGIHGLMITQKFRN